MSGQRLSPCMLHVCLTENKNADISISWIFITDQSSCASECTNGTDRSNTHATVTRVWSHGSCPPEDPRSGVILLSAVKGAGGCERLVADAHAPRFHIITHLPVF